MPIVPEDLYPPDPPIAGEEEHGDTEMNDILGAEGLDRGNSVPPPGPNQGRPTDAGGATREDGTHPDPHENEEPERHGDVGTDNLAGNIPNLLPDLRRTQGYINALRVADLGDSGMEHEDIDNLRRPEPVDDLDDPSPLLQSLSHFVNNDLASWDHYDTRCYVSPYDDYDTLTK